MIRNCIAISALILFAFTCGVKAGETKIKVEEPKTGESELKTFEEQLAYSIGLEMGANLRNIPFKIDINVVMQGLRDMADGKQPRISIEQMQAVKEEFTKRIRAKHEELVNKNKEMAGKSLEEGQKFLEENKKKEGVRTTASGLQYEVLKEGKGEKPNATDRVKVHYSGRFISGKEFDSSYKRNQPAEFSLAGGVIQGWTEGLQLMKVGSKYRFAIPADLAYGEKGRGPIPPNTALVFDVELLDIVKPEK